MFFFRRMNIDQLATLYFFYPIIKRIPQFDKSIRITSLMYHSISAEKEEDVHPYFRMNTDPKLFDIHMEFLKSHNYRVVDLKKAVSLLNGQNTESNRYIVITFDDGYKDFYTRAAPILEKYEFPATVFLPTDCIGKAFNRYSYLSWNDIIELSRREVLFGSHTVSHPKLVLLSETEIVRELEVSKKTIEDKIGMSVESFSYPYSFPEADPQFKELLKKNLMNTGYLNGVTTIIGSASSSDDAFFLKRIPINSCDNLPIFKAKLEGGYDWLHPFQLLAKKLKRISKRALYQKIVRDEKHEKAK